MEEIFWFFRTHRTTDVLLSLQIPLLVGFVLYQINYPVLLLRRFWLAVRRRQRAAVQRQLPAALLVLPTLLRNEGELEGLKRAIRSAVSNDYPGPLVVVAAIDDGPGHPEIYRRLEAWVANIPRTAKVAVFATATSRRTGKAVAIDHGVELVRTKVLREELPALPPLFFNMDGDSELGAHALKRMALRLLTPSPLWGHRPNIVTSNVTIAERVYWRGWRAYFSVPGQIAILVAREYLQSISVGKFNSRLIPSQEASGALYCTYSVLHTQAPRWAAFMQTLTVMDWVKWWLGVAPPSFAKSGVAPLPEAQTGPGDDTWMTWLATCARWQGGALSLELPRTPVHAFAAALRAFFLRPVGYEPTARIVTKTPTTVGALFRQRVRWNSSRIQDLLRWFPGLAFHWSAGITVVVTTVQVLTVHATILGSLVVWPFVSGRGGLTTLALAVALNVGVRVTDTVFSLVIDNSLRRSWRLLLGVPLAVPYHIAFNIFPTITGCVEDLFLFGVNTKFSPEETYVKSGLSRIALAYRVRRAFALAVRSVIVGDVPLGAFWFGWHATRWTPNGFEGWNSRRAGALRPIPAAVRTSSNVVSYAKARETLRPQPSLRPASVSTAPPPSAEPISGTRLRVAPESVPVRRSA